MKKRKEYEVKGVKMWMEYLMDNGYSKQQLWKGCCGLGDFILWSNKPLKANYLVKEIYHVNWTSGQTIHKFIFKTKKIKNEIKQFEQYEKALNNLCSDRTKLTLEDLQILFDHYDLTFESYKELSMQINRSDYER